MPGFDGTGPKGQGRRTGGGFGLCTGAVRDEALSSAEIGARFGVGRGGPPRGGGRGRCFGGGRAGFRARGTGRGFGDIDGFEGGARFADELERLARENEELRSRLAELEPEKKE